MLSLAKRSNDFIYGLQSRHQQSGRDSGDVVLLPKPLTRISQALSSEKLQKCVQGTYRITPRPRRVVERAGLRFYFSYDAERRV